MKRFIAGSAVLVLATATMQAANAENGSKKEMTGAGAGAVIGGAAGGPPGAIIGAAIGAVLGDRLHKKSVTIDTLNVEVETRDTQINALSDQLHNEQHESRMLERELVALDESGVRELHRLLGQGIEFDLPFRTGETTLPNALDARISNIASLLSATPGLSVQIDGYADPRGSVAFNAALSLKRAMSVRDLLLSAGVRDERIQTFGHGESMTPEPTDTSVDQLALQRRVTVTFYRDPAATTGVARLERHED